MRERGNILFLILLAVVLFAALAYAVTSSMRGGGKDAGREKLDLVAAQLIQNAGLIEQTMMRAQMMHNVPDWGFDIYPGGGANATCTNAQCRIFTEQGGGVPYFKVPAQYTTNGTDAGVGTVERSGEFLAFQVENVGTGASELVIMYTFLNKDLCEAINRLAQNNVNAGISDTLGTGGYGYTGTLTAMPVSAAVMGDTNTTLRGQKTFCTFTNNTAQYRFVHVLMER